MTSKVLQEKDFVEHDAGIQNDGDGMITKISEAERKLVLRKLDIHLLPLISMLYMLAFLDRSNIGNAKIAGMVKDAHLTGLKFNIIAAVFFIPYALVEVPCNILLKLARPSRWIPSIMVAWGIVMTLMCLCNTFKGLLAARFFLGLTESGLFPGVTFYLSFWYRRQDIAFRIALFFSTGAAAGAFGGILAFGIEHMEGVGSLHGWQWIFCLEGLLTIIIATVSYFFMHDYPETATFLTPHEKRIVVQMLKEDVQSLATHYDTKFVWQALSDYRTWVQALLYLYLLVPLHSITLFLPTIINSLGYSAADAQLLTVPPFVAAWTVAIPVGYLSDKYNLRGPFIIGGCIVSLIGYIVLITETRRGVGYAGSVIAAVGVYPTIAVSLAWAGSAAGGYVRKGVTLAIVIGVGNLGGICASFIYIKAPRFFVGHGVCIAFLTMAIFFSSFIMWDFQRLNKAKEAYCTSQELDGNRRDEFAKLGSESPLFRFTL